jgi:hypothetical protein
MQNTPSFALNPHYLPILLAQGNPINAPVPSAWRPLPSSS